MPDSREIQFIGRPMQAEARRPGGGGMEATADSLTPPAEKPVDLRPTTPEQKARATDLFLRGAISAADLVEARANRGGFEAKIGRPNFLPAAFLETGAATSRSTFLIRTSGVDYVGRSGSWSGTGFLLGPNILITNHHVLNSPEVAAAANCVFNYQTGMDGQPMATQTFRLKPDRLFLTSPANGGLDYSIVWVEGDPGREFGAARVSRQAFIVAEQEFANIISHPQGRMKEVCVQENEVQWQDDLVVHYTSDTEPGSSGASVCNNNWQLIALHHASKPSNIAGYPVLNEGIKLSAIAADLERISASTGASADMARQVLALFGGTDERLGFFGTLGRRAPNGAERGLEVVRDTFQGTEQDIDVGFWNVEWLTRNYDGKKSAVAKVIHALNLDVWSLEESSPNAAAAVAGELHDAFGLDFGYAAAEPQSADGKQSCTLLWNKATVDVVEETWGEPIETWLQTRSPDFDDLNLGGFEAIHGKIFDRYPALFKVTAKQATAGTHFTFYLIPVHLKAMDEGSLRRKMASKILAVAIQKKIEEGAAADWIIGGDFNAKLATSDFDNLVDGGLVPVSAADEQGGAISYIKSPKSLIDHIFLSPNLAQRYREEDYVVVAAERTFPNYVAEVSDHRPVLVRLNLNPGHESVGGPESASARPETNKSALAELMKRLAASPSGATPAAHDEFEARRRRPPNETPATAAGGDGYKADFLGREKRVPLPGLPDSLADLAVTVNRQGDGVDRFALKYTHYSVVMNGRRRMPFYSAVNIDGTQLRRVPRSNNWFLDSRIPANTQSGPDVYSNNDLDKGHMTRRLDPVWGSPGLANRADADSFCYTNACPQHKDLNQREWQQLEDYVLDNAGAHELKLCVITGPVLRSGDRSYRGIQIPEEFWKVVAMIKSDSHDLSATGYILSQRDMLNAGFEAEFAFGQFRTYQVTLARIASMTGLDFGRLPEFDPLARGRHEAAGMESATAAVKLIGGAGDLVF